MKFLSAHSVFPASFALAACALAVPAFAHVGLVETSAIAGTPYKASFRVGHPCKDAKATTGITVQLPAGFTFEAAEPRAGWTQTVQGSRVSWQAATPAAGLGHDQRGEFVLRGTLPAQAGPLWFKVLQTCDKGSADWSQVPAAGASAEGLASPAARLDVLPVGTALVDVRDGWVRSTVAGQQGTGAFMSFTSRTDLRLVGLSSPVAGVAEVHEMKMEGDVMRMRALPSGIALPAGKQVDLKSGGYHVMLMDLKQPIANGSKVPLTLNFEDAKGQKSKLDISLPAAVTAQAANVAGKPEKPGEGQMDHSMHKP